MAFCAEAAAVEISNVIKLTDLSWLLCVRVGVIKFAWAPIFGPFFAFAFAFASISE